MTAPLSPSTTLRLTHITKTYPGVRALHDVTFEVLEGEVHAFLGENGAGKSTLMAVAAGAVAPDSGTIEILGHHLEQASPALAQSFGLGVVYQHPSVLDDLTVAENLLFALPAHLRPPQGQVNEWAVARLRVVGAEIDPNARAEELSVAQRQLLEIAKALALDAKVLILDEPTESLTAAESASLFLQVDALRQRGASVVYISHRLPEVRRVADRITVLRDGEIRGTFAASAISDDEVLALIIGRPVQQTFPPKPAPRPDDGTAALLRVTDLRGPRLSGVTFDISPGEIVGLAGVEGNGQREVLRALGGLLPHHGTVEVNGAKADTRTPSRSRRSGILYLPRDRYSEGVFRTMTVRENLSLMVLRELAKAGFLQRGKEQQRARAQIESFDVRAPSSEVMVETLSGGNQQKVLLARSMAAEPIVLLADEPTRGVDVGARIEIYQLLRGAAATARAVIVASSDTLELQGLCDKILVFERGHVVKVLTGDDITEAKIMAAALTSEVHQLGQTGPARSSGRMGRALRGDYAPGGILAVLVLALGAATGAHAPHFLGALNLSATFLLAAVLALVASGQLVALLGASIDLSVGPLMGLTVVILSFFDQQGSGYVGLVIGGLIAVGVGVLVGATNTFLIRTMQIGPVISTLVTFIALEGVNLLLRPQPGGAIDSRVTSGISTSFGAFPVAFLVVIALTLVAEAVLRRRQAGRELRAVGSDAQRAFRMGARVGATALVAQVTCSLCAVGAGILLASQVGIGDPTLGGSDYTLLSLTAAVLGGASIFGGRGSFVGTFLGALLLQEITAATSFLNWAESWQEWLPGILILAGAGMYSRLRSRGTRRAMSAVGTG
jgi:ribose transport system permease protein/ribose transport system ATP-binding protein